MKGGYRSGNDRHGVHDHSGYGNATLPQWKQQGHEKSKWGRRWYDDQGGGQPWSLDVEGELSSCVRHSFFTVASTAATREACGTIST